MKEFEFRCSSCNEVHKGMPGFGSDAPIYYFSIPEAERESKVSLTHDTCVIENKDFFVKACLEIPVEDFEEPFVFTTWVSLSENNFLKFEMLYKEEKRDQNEPMFGWFSGWIWPFENTEQLKTRIHFRNNGIRPLIEIEPTDHPLSVAQYEGISIQQVAKIYEYYAHGKE